MTCAPSNAGRPVRHSKRTHPTENTSARGSPVSGALQLLGRDVAGRTQHHARARQPVVLARDAGDPEVDELDAIDVVVDDEDVARLDVAMDQAPPVGEGERGQQRGS